MSSLLVAEISRVSGLVSLVIILPCHGIKQFLSHFQVLEVFEWMVEGRGTTGPITAETETYDILIAACHERGLLEKAFEVSRHRV